MFLTPRGLTLVFLSQRCHQIFYWETLFISRPLILLLPVVVVVVVVFVVVVVVVVGVVVVVVVGVVGVGGVVGIVGVRWRWRFASFYVGILQWLVMSFVVIMFFVSKDF